MKLLIAARDKVVRSSLNFLINYSTEDVDTEPAIDLIDLLSKLRTQAIDLVLIEWEFFLGESMEMSSLIKRAYPKITFIVIGIMKADRKEAFEAKLDAFYLKSDSPKKLLKIISDYKEHSSP